MTALAHAFGSGNDGWTSIGDISGHRRIAVWCGCVVAPHRDDAPGFVFDADPSTGTDDAGPLR